MKITKKQVLLLALLPLAAWLASSQRPSSGLTSERAFLESSTHFTLYSLSPRGTSSQVISVTDNPAAQEKFYGHIVLGKTEITDVEERARLIAALYRGIKGGLGRAFCFAPRHGIHATSGLRKLDLVICFECHGIHAHTHVWESYVPTMESPQPAFDAALSRAKVPLGPRPKPE